MTTNKDINDIEWQFSDAGTLQYVRPLLVERHGKELLRAKDIITESLLKRTQDNDKLEEYYDDIKKTFKRDWNSLSLDDDDFCDVCVDLTLMLLTQLEGIENKRFPEMGNSCWAEVLLKEKFEDCGQKDAKLKQQITGRTNIRLPISTNDIRSNDYALGYQFEKTFGREEYLVSYSVSKSCSDVDGWGVIPSDESVLVNSSHSSTIQLNWCGSSIEDTNLCLTLHSISDKSEISLQSPIKKKIRTSGYDSFSNYGNYDDNIAEKDLPSCRDSEDIDSGNCWINGTQGTCKGSVDGCDYVSCGRTLIGAVSGGAVLALFIVIVAVIIFVQKKRNSSQRHPAESPLPYTAPKNNRTAEEYSYK